MHCGDVLEGERGACALQILFPACFPLDASWKLGGLGVWSPVPMYGDAKVRVCREHSGSLRDEHAVRVILICVFGEYQVVFWPRASTCLEGSCFLNVAVAQS